MAVPSERRITIVLDTKGNPRGIVETGRDLERLSRGVDSLGDRMSSTTSDADGLNAELKQTEDRVKSLQVQIARTRDLSLFGDLRREERNAAQLRKLITTLGETGEDAGDAFSAGVARTSVGGLPTRLRGALILALAGMAPVVVPVLSAAIAGAVTGAVGLGGIAGGIAAASKDTRVRSSARQFSRDIATEFFSAGGAFVQPTVDALGILKDAFQDLDLDKSFALVAPHVTTVAKGIADMAREFMPGFNRALKDAGPVLDALATVLPTVGQAMGDFLAELAASEGAASGLIFGLNAVSSALVFTGRIVAWLGNRFHDALQFFAAFAGVMEDVPIFPPAVREGWAQLNNDAERLLHNSQGLEHQFIALPGVAATTTEAFSAQAEAAATLARVMGDANAQIDQFFRTEMSIPKAADAVEAAIDDFTEALRENGRTFDANTEKGRSNRDAVRDMIAAAQEHRAALAANASTSASAQIVYDKEIARIEKLAAKYGLTRLELEKIAGDYTVNVITTFITRGRFALPSGDFRVAGGGRLLAGEGTIRLTATPIPNLNPPPAIQRQHGGPAPGGRAILVGERRPEVLELPPGVNGYVHPSVGAYQASQGGMTVRLEVVSGGGGAFDEFMAGWIRKYVRVTGGGSVQTAFGR